MVRSCRLVIPTLWIMANSRFRETMAVTILLTKLSTPTRAITTLMAYPMTEEERVCASYWSIMVCREVMFIPMAWVC